MKKYLILFFFASLLSCEKTELPRCNDGIMNGDETGIDCGGICAVCYTCSDGIKNQFETDIDCGGECTPCPNEWVGYNTPFQYGLNNMRFLDKNNGYVWDNRPGDGYYGTYKTNDGGKTWTQINFPGVDGTSGYLLELFPIAMDKLFAQISTSASFLYKSSDGGQSWQTVQVPAIFNVFFTAISFHNDQNGVMTQWGHGTSSTNLTSFFKTNDGGETWILSATTEDLVQANITNDSIACNNLTAFDIGLTYAYSPGWRFISNDYGSTWTALPATAIANSSKLEWLNPQVGIMRGRQINTVAYTYFQNDYFMTYDSGNTWSKLLTLENGYPTYTDIYFKDSNTLIGFSSNNFNYNYAVSIDLSSKKYEPYGNYNGYTLTTLGLNGGSFVKCQHIENTSYCLTEGALLVLNL